MIQLIKTFKEGMKGRRRERKEKRRRRIGRRRKANVSQLFFDIFEFNYTGVSRPIGSIFHLLLSLNNSDTYITVARFNSDSIVLSRDQYYHSTEPTVHMFFLGSHHPMFHSQQKNHIINCKSYKYKKKPFFLFFFFSTNKIIMVKVGINGFGRIGRIVSFNLKTFQPSTMRKCNFNKHSLGPQKCFTQS